MSYNNRYTPPPTDSSQSTLAWGSQLGPMNSASQVIDNKESSPSLEMTRRNEVHSKTHPSCMLNLASIPDYDLTVTYKGEDGAVQFLPVVIFLEVAIKKLQKYNLDQGISVNFTLLRQHTGDLHCPSMIAVPVSIVGELTCERQVKFIDNLYPVLERLIQGRLQQLTKKPFELRDLTFEFVRHQTVDQTVDPQRYNNTAVTQLIHCFIHSEVVFTDCLTDVITVAGLAYHLKMIWEKERALSHGDTGELWRDGCLTKKLKTDIINVASHKGCKVVNVKQRMNGVKDYHGATETLQQSCFVGLRFKRKPINEIVDMPVHAEMLLHELKAAFRNHKLSQDLPKKDTRKISDETLTAAQRKRIKYGV